MINNGKDAHAKHSFNESKVYLKYKKELMNEGTQYFIKDTHGNSDNKYTEQDFISYSWNKHRYNRVEEGDLFIYRRPQKTLKANQEFYFFGAGKFGEIIEGDKGNLTAKIEKSLKFDNCVFKSDLEDADWTFKKRKRKDWQHFFNQYGMNKITQEDFMMLLGHQEG